MRLFPRTKSRINQGLLSTGKESVFEKLGCKNACSQNRGYSPQPTHASGPLFSPFQGRRNDFCLGRPLKIVTKVSFFVQCRKMQLITLQKFHIQTCFSQFLWVFSLISMEIGM